MKQNIIHFFEVKEPSTEYIERINRLIRQLSPTANNITQNDMETLAKSTDSHLYLMTVDEEIAAMCTLATYWAPTGRKAWIEDVVVDEKYRGMKLGRMIVENVINEAHKYAPCTLMLTSRPTRIAANALYKSAGFDRKDTNVYRMVIA